MDKGSKDGKRKEEDGKSKEESKRRGMEAIKESMRERWVDERKNARRDCRTELHTGKRKYVEEKEM